MQYSKGLTQNEIWRLRCEEEERGKHAPTDLASGSQVSGDVGNLPEVIGVPVEVWFSFGHGRCQEPTWRMPALWGVWGLSVGTYMAYSPALHRRRRRPWVYVWEEMGFPSPLMLWS